MEKSIIAYDYPELYEQEAKTIKGILYMTYKFEVKVPAEWDEDCIKEDMRENTEEYQQDLIETEMDIRS